MSLDLAVDELEAVPGVGDSLAKAGCQLGKKVTVLEGGGFGVQVQLGDLARKQCMPLRIESSHVALGVPALARNTQKLSGGSLACDGSVDLAVIVQEALQGFCVSAIVGLIGAGHQQGEVLLLGCVSREVRMDALGDLTKEALKARGWVELFGFAGITECRIMGLLCALAGILSSAARGVGVVEVDFALRDARFEIVELSVEDTDLVEITSFKGLEFGAELGKLRFAFRKLRSNGSKLLALVEDVEIVRGLLEDDFGWHTASRVGTSSLAERSTAFCK
jgi:hypothetical protein